MTFLDVKRAMSILLPVLFLCSCGGISSQESLTAPTISSRSDAVSTLAVGSGSRLFISEYQQDQAAIFNAQNQQIGAFKAPAGLIALDTQGDYYDVNPGVTNELLVFTPPYKTPPDRISFRDNYTWGVAVDERTGVFAVVAIYAGGGPGPTTIEFFKHGASVPCATLKTNAGQLGTGAAFDRQGTLFLSDSENNGTNGIASIAGECNAKTVIVNSLPPTGELPEPPFTFNSNDNLVFQDQYTRHILTYAHPKNGAFALPLSTTILSLPSPAFQAVVYLACLASDGAHLWATDFSNQQVLLEFRYPQGGVPVARINVAHGGYCAVSPPLIPL